MDEHINHGQWIWDPNAPYRDEGAYKCSKCGRHSDFEENYCPNCGSKMDGDKDKQMKRGKWLKRMSTSDSFKCSVCGNNHEYETTYCPHCGARMDGDKT